MLGEGLDGLIGGLSSPEDSVRGAVVGEAFFDAGHRGLADILLEGDEDGDGLGEAAVGFNYWVRPLEAGETDTNSVVEVGVCDGPADAVGDGAGPEAPRRVVRKVVVSDRPAVVDESGDVAAPVDPNGGEFGGSAIGPATDVRVRCGAGATAEERGVVGGGHGDLKS